MQLSIVTSVYCTARFLREFAERADATAKARGLADYEMIFVTDGSPDDAVNVLKELKASYPRIRVLELSRNFGHHPALWCGLAAARGDLVFLADSDCEAPPEALALLHDRLLANDSDVAFAYRRQSREPRLLRWVSQLFWRAFGALAEVRVHPGMLTERLMRRPYVDALLSLNERSLFLAGMMQWVGFRQEAVPMDTVARDGPPSYTWRRRAALAFDALTSFSIVPMKALFAAGGALATAALLSALALAAVKLARPEMVVRGFTALAVLLLFSLGVLLAAIGLVGLYLGKVFLQAKGRPLYIVRREF